MLNAAHGRWQDLEACYPIMMGESGGPSLGFCMIIDRRRAIVSAGVDSARHRPGTAIEASGTDCRALAFPTAAVTLERRAVYSDLYLAVFPGCPLRPASIGSESRNMAVDQSKSDAPQFLVELLKSATAHHSSGDYQKAEEEYLQLMEHDYRKADILLLLARVVARRGDLEGAIGHFDKVLELAPHRLDALIEKGALLHRIGMADDAARCFVLARSIAPENELVLTNLAVALADSGRRDEALGEFRRIVEQKPDNIYVRHQLRRLTSQMVPFWHIPMLNDVRRNQAFEQAIRKAIEKEGPEARILDIGTGSDLLSMMAARAGARHSVTCEKVPVIAETAERIRRVERLRRTDPRGQQGIEADCRRPGY